MIPYSSSYKQLFSPSISLYLPINFRKPGFSPSRPLKPFPLQHLLGSQVNARQASSCLITADYPALACFSPCLFCRPGLFWELPSFLTAAQHREAVKNAFFWGTKGCCVAIVRGTWCYSRSSVRQPWGCPQTCSPGSLLKSIQINIKTVQIHDALSSVSLCHKTQQWGFLFGLMSRSHATTPLNSKLFV